MDLRATFKQTQIAVKIIYSIPSPIHIKSLNTLILWFQIPIPFATMVMLGMFIVITGWITLYNSLTRKEQKQSHLGMISPIQTIIPVTSQREVMIEGKPP